MSEFENTPFEENENGSVSPEENVSESIRDIKEITDAPDSPKDIFGVAKRYAKPIGVVAVILVLAILLTVVFGGKDKEANNLFCDNMIVFNEVNTETGEIMYGIIDKKGKTIADADYVLAYLPGEGMIVAKEPPVGDELFVQNPASYGLMTGKGEEVTKFNFNGCAPEFSDGLIAMSQNGKWGFVNKKGEWEIKASFGDALSFSDSLAGVKDASTSKWGFVNKKGEFVIKPTFEDVGNFADGLAPAKKNGKWGFVDKKGEWKIDNDYLEVMPFNDGIARAKDINELWGFINEKGKWTVKPRFQEINDFSENLAAAKKNGKWGFIDKKGEWKIDNDYALVGNFADGLAYALEDGDTKFGYIGKNGKWKIEPDFDAASDFSNSIACVKDGKKYGYIAKNGKWKIEPSYAYATSFYDDGYAVVQSAKEETEWFVIDKKGENILKDTFDGIMP